MNCFCSMHQDCRDGALDGCKMCGKALVEELASVGRALDPHYSGGDVVWLADNYVKNTGEINSINEKTFLSMAQEIKDLTQKLADAEKQIKINGAHHQAMMEAELSENQRKDDRIQNLDEKLSVLDRAEPDSKEMKEAMLKRAYRYWDEIPDSERGAVHMAMFAMSEYGERLHFAQVKIKELSHLHSVGCPCAEKKSSERRFPIQSDRGNHAPTSCAWSIADKAYSQYRAKYGASQSLDRLAERGGFSANEMDEFYPSWRNEESELAAAQARIGELGAARIAYASEFDGDVGSIHQNIRATKSDLAAAHVRIKELEKKLSGVQAVIDDMPANECTCGADDGDNLGSGGQATGCYKHELISAMGAKS